MPDSKITALTSISTSTDPANDPLVIVDVSDTSMAATGTTKKVTLNQLLGASGTATLASATITGDLTVDTNTLKVDSANNRVGVGTASPSTTFHTNSDGVASGAGWTAIGRFNNVAQTKGIDLGYNPSNNNAVITALSGGATSGFEWWSFDGGWATRMTLNSTGLGVGTSPATKLDVRGANNASQATFSGTAGRGLLISTRSDSLADDRTVILNAQFATGSLGQLVIQTAGTDRLLVDASGNVGIGVTPSAWAAGYKAIQIAASQSTALMGSGNQTELTTNAFFDGAWKYQGAGTVAASRYSQQSGVHYWYTAAAGAAGTAIGSGFTNAAMTLDASGNLIIGTTGTNWSTVAGFYYFAGSSLNITRDGNPSLLLNRLTSDGAIADFRRSGSAVGSISVTTTSTAYNTSSDYRLKESVAPLIGGLARVSALKPSVYKWKADGSNGEGFIAHELAEVVPAAVSGEKDAVNEDGSIKAQGVDLSKVVPVLVAAIQELAAEVNALKNA